MAGVDLGSIVAHLKLEMSDFNNNLNKAADQLQKTQDNFRGFDKLGQSFTNVGKTLTTGITMPVMAIGASVVKTQMQFEDSMAKVKALSGATGEEFKKLEDTAKKYGETTVFSASECADALGLELDDIAKANIAKLKARYPQGFSCERSINRED